jgi:hypothetical protein
MKSKNIKYGVLTMLLFVLTLMGCDSIGPAESTTQSVTGRVLAADTLQPLAGVTVSRVVPGQNIGTPDKGAQLLQQGRPEITGADGVFEVPGESSVTLFRRSDGWSARLMFRAPGYVSWQTNFSADTLTNQTDAGTTVVNVGNVLLRPK